MEDFWETNPDSDECSRPNPSDVNQDCPSGVSSIPEKTLQEPSVGRATMVQNVIWENQLGRTRPAGSLTAMESQTGANECLNRFCSAQTVC